MLSKSNKDFLFKFVVTFKGLFVRILMMVHAGLAVDFLLSEKKLDGPYYVLLLPIILVGIDGVVMTILQTRRDVSHLWPICAIFYLASVIPIIWISEFDAMDTKTSTYGTLIGMWTKLGMFFVLIAGRWIVSLGNLSHAEVTVLLLALVGHAPDSMALLNTLNEKMDDADNTNQTYKLIVVLTVFTLSVVQFAIKTPDVDGADQEKKKKLLKKNQKVDSNKYLDFGCLKGKIPSQAMNESSKFSLFKDSVMKKAKQAQEVKDETQAKVQEAKKSAQAKVEQGKGGFASLKGSIMDKTRAAKERALKNDKLKKCSVYLGVLLHLFIALALHAGPVFAVRLVMSVRFDVFNEVHIFFLVKNGFECLVIIFRFIQTVRNSTSIEDDFSLDAAMEKVDEIPTQLPASDNLPETPSVNPSGGLPAQSTNQV